MTADVVSYLKGGSEETITFKVPGGRLGRYRSVVVGAPVFARGDEAVLFLKSNKAHGDGLPDVFGLNQGVFRVKVDPRTGQKMVVPPPVMATAPAPTANLRRSSADPSTAVRWRSTRSGPAFATSWPRRARASHEAAVARVRGRGRRPRAGGSGWRVPETRHSHRQPDREPALAAVSHPLLHHRRRRDRCDLTAIPGRRLARVRHLARRRERRDLVDVRRLRPGAAVCRRWRERHRIREPAGAGSDPRRDDVHDRRDRRAHPRVGHLTSIRFFPGRQRRPAGRIATTSSRSRCTRSGTSSACRTPRSARPNSSGADAA